MFPHTHTTHISKRKRDREITHNSPNGGRDQGKKKKKTLAPWSEVVDIFPTVLTASKSDLWIQLKYERLFDFCYECGRLGHLKRDCYWKQGQQDNSTMPGIKKGFGRWMMAESIPSKANSVFDMFFNDVIEAYGVEKQMNSSKGLEVVHVIHEEDERVEHLVSSSEANTLLHKVISTAKNSVPKHMDGTPPLTAASREGTTLETPIFKFFLGSCSNNQVTAELENEVTPQLVIRLGPCGSIE